MITPLKKITKAALNELPQMKYEGKYQLIDRVRDVKPAVDICSQATRLGFDTETRPAFTKGEYYSVALLQIALPTMVFLFRVNKTGFTPDLADLFENPNIMKIGIATRDDIKELRKLHDFTPHQLVDLNEMGQKLGFESIGARNYAGLLLGGRISKRQQVSNWEQRVLTPAQMNYAATDAWICLEVYEKMKKITPSPTSLPHR